MKPKLNIALAAACALTLGIGSAKSSPGLVDGSFSVNPISPVFAGVTQVTLSGRVSIDPFAPTGTTFEDVTIFLSDGLGNTYSSSVFGPGAGPFPSTPFSVMVTYPNPGTFSPQLEATGDVFVPGGFCTLEPCFTPVSFDIFSSAGDVIVTAAATPLPAAIPLFATGLGALGLLGWRRKRKAQAVTA
jgi:hypothetical protein